MFNLLWSDIPDETDDSQARKKKEPKEEEYIPTHRVPDHMSTDIFFYIHSYI